MAVKLLDCTLRDGGHINNAEFGKETIRELIKGLTFAGLDYVELGFLKNGSFTENQAFYNNVTEIYELLPEGNKTANYTVMVRPDWYDIKQLSRSDGRVNTIRFAFYYKDFELMRQYALKADTLGYRIICNPVNIMGYSDGQLIELIKEINDMHPAQITIVDTYGAMTFEALQHIYEVVDTYLECGIRIGLHLHENQSLSFALAQYFIKLNRRGREAVIDGSLLGMGRIPGNLCIELICNYMNMHLNTNYNLSPLYKLIGQYIQPMKRIIPWGYSPEYYITARDHMHRSYAEFLNNKGDLQLEDVIYILEQIKVKEMRDFFNQDYVQKKYDEYKRGK